MPLRVAEKDGVLKAVNECFDCPFNINHSADILKVINKKFRFRCGHEAGKESEFLSGDCIPVWCPLPEPGEEGETPLQQLINFLKESKGSGIITEEQFDKMIGTYYQPKETK